MHLTLTTVLTLAVAAFTIPQRPGGFRGPPQFAPPQEQATAVQATTATNTQATATSAQTVVVTTQASTPAEESGCEAQHGACNAACPADDGSGCLGTCLGEFETCQAAAT